MLINLGDGDPTYQNNVTGALGAAADAAPATDSSSASIIGLLKMLAQRLRNPRIATTGTSTSVSLTASTAADLVAANQGELGFYLFSPSTNTANILVRFGGAASATQYTFALPPNSLWIDEGKRLQISGFCTAAATVMATRLS